jgi:hypothetical protein
VVVHGKRKRVDTLELDLEIAGSPRRKRRRVEELKAKKPEFHEKIEGVTPLTAAEL